MLEVVKDTHTHRKERKKGKEERRWEGKKEERDSIVASRTLGLTGGAPGQGECAPGVGT